MLDDGGGMKSCTLNQQSFCKTRRNLNKAHDKTITDTEILAFFIYLYV